MAMLWDFEKIVRLLKERADLRRGHSVRMDQRVGAFPVGDDEMVPGLSAFCLNRPDQLGHGATELVAVPRQFKDPRPRALRQEEVDRNALFRRGVDLVENARRFHEAENVVRLIVELLAGKGIAEWEHVDTHIPVRKV